MENTERQMVVVRQPGETRMLATITKETFLREFSVPAVQVACRAVNSYPAVFSANTPALIEIEQHTVMIAFKHTWRDGLLICVSL